MFRQPSDERVRPLLRSLRPRLLRSVPGLAGNARGVQQIEEVSWQLRMPSAVQSSYPMSYLVLAACGVVPGLLLCLEGTGDNNSAFQEMHAAE